MDSSRVLYCAGYSTCLIYTVFVNVFLNSPVSVAVKIFVRLDLCHDALVPKEGAHSLPNGLVAYDSGVAVQVELRQVHVAFGHLKVDYGGQGSIKATAAAVRFIHNDLLHREIFLTDHLVQFVAIDCLKIKVIDSDI